MHQVQTQRQEHIQVLVETKVTRTPLFTCRAEFAEFWVQFHPLHQIAGADDVVLVWPLLVAA
jgi:hypothetical protein